MNRRPFAAPLLALIVAALAACANAPAPADAPRLQALSEAEAQALWAGPAALTPVGSAIVQRIPVDGGVAVTCSQPYALRLSTGKPGGVVIQCGGSCKLKPGATFDQCKTSGCLSNGRTCSPLVCSGGCELSRQCTASKPSAFAIL